MIPVVKRKTIQEDGSMIQPEETLTLRDGRPFTIRSVEPEDAPRMIEYMKTILGETPFLLRTPEEFDRTEEEVVGILSRHRDEPRGVMLVGIMDGRIIACADLNSRGNKSRLFHRCDMGISVRKEFWHQGIGSLMMERLIAFAKENGFEQIELTVESKNRRAIVLYMKNGFTVYGTRPHGMKYPDGSYDDDYLMVKML